MITKITDKNNEIYMALFEDATEAMKTFIKDYIKLAEAEDGTKLISVVNNNGSFTVSVEEEQLGLEIKTITYADDVDDLTYVYYEMGIPKEITITDDIAKQICQAYYDVGGKVEGLEEYFGIIETLTNHLDTNFQILPLYNDEGLFTIDANTRIITPPLNNYTYAVKGDNLAETIFFSINRYYDNIDLNTKKIAILSQYNGQKVFTPVDLRDITSIPNTIIFGWTIGQAVTNTFSGNLEFSVRFYDLEGDEINYSLSTQPQTLMIKNGLNFFLPKDISDNGIIFDESSTRVKSLLKNADILNTTALNAPIFNYGEGSSLQNLSDGSCTLSAAAHSIDTLPISYYWVKKNPSGVYEKIPDSDNNSNTTPEYIALLPSELTEATGNKYGIFYVDTPKEPGSEEVIKTIFTWDASTNPFDLTKQYYRLGSSHTVDSAGFYQCVANVERGNIRKKSSRSGIFEIPFPSKFSINKKYPDENLTYFLDYEDEENFSINNQTNLVTISEKTENENRIMTKLLDKFNINYNKDNQNYKGDITKNLYLIGKNPDKYKLNMKNTLNGESTENNFSDIVIYPSLPAPDINITCSINPNNHLERNLHVSVNNRPDAVNYEIHVYKKENSVEIKPISFGNYTIANYAVYVVEVTYSSQYHTLTTNKISKRTSTIDTEANTAI